MSETVSAPSTAPQAAAQDYASKGAAAAVTTPTADQPTLPLLKRLWRDWMAPHKAGWALALLMMAFVAATTGAYPLVVKEIFDMLAARDEAAFLLMPILIVGLAALRGATLYGSAVVTNRIVQRVLTDMRRASFAHLLEADYSRLNREPTGHLVSRLMNDINAIGTGMAQLLTSAVRDFLTVVALVAALVSLDWLLSLVALILYPFAAIPIVRIGRHLRGVSRDTQEQLGAVTSNLSESFSGTNLIKTFRLEPYLKERLKGDFENMFRLQMKAAESKARLDPLLEVVGGLAIAAVAALAGFRIFTGAATVGDFTGFITALLLLSQPIRALSILNASLQQGLAGAQRLFDLLDDVPQVVDRPGASPLVATAGEVTFDHVSFRYGGQDPAVHDLSFTVPGGTMAALVGRSGAGKTTVFHLIPRLYDVDEGAIRIDGQDLRDVTLGSLRQTIATVSQDVTLFNDTVRENIRLGDLNADDAAIEAAARAAAAHDFIVAMPDGYASVVGDRGTRLSGGQRQRIALARAILKNAAILLLDEATSALDAEAERVVQNALRAFPTKPTMLVIAHRLATVQDADIIFVLDEGKIVEQGTHEALLGQDGLYAHLCRSQLLQSDAPS